MAEHGRSVRPGRDGCPLPMIVDAAAWVAAMVLVVRDGTSSR